MRTTVAKWGNSLGIRLPRQMIETVRMAEGQTVDLEIQDDAIVIRNARKRFKLADLLAEMKPEQRHEEQDFGAPVGKEEW
ncbi:AbrB/MazE/SpoVT family DNA-binding domain-containing protein [Caulobacter sp. FWC2]|uniref:AbrB/MazE/SpoVT family DNA-binding domain-containing protein n=1 Tax=Caulobacter sp. FWC2 TaxID=69664 RepID=UPI000C157F19|nr:AbrB/MazE/SpoVT family DNA-binding domain-containing protein [Caulobacter sp. FWC2]PIB91261.1 AbrB/MazE/SpoVT family DNA-binding domain-containing protein [Caulobacter sp. FWC2]